MAAILTITETGESEFKVYGAAEENERDKGMQTRRMVGALSFLLTSPSLIIRLLPLPSSFCMQNTVPYFV
jgi:hypothetical protein